jgi:hypothetical protein
VDQLAITVQTERDWTNRKGVLVYTEYPAYTPQVYVGNLSYSVCPIYASRGVRGSVLTVADHRGAGSRVPQQSRRRAVRFGLCPRTLCSTLSPAPYSLLYIVPVRL